MIKARMLLVAVFCALLGGCAAPANSTSPGLGDYPSQTLPTDSNKAQLTANTT